MKDDMIMRGIFVTCMMKNAGRHPVDTERAAHAQMHDQRLMIIQHGDKIFRAPPERDNASLGQASRKIVRKGQTQILAPEFDSGERRAFQRRRQSQTNRFDFRQFRHSGAPV